ncbi:MAG: glycosyltransferase, partial [Sulfuricellaceae bacterium]|nr:glycosyltransferase [Sulfuricellaceae bacterium]
YKGHETLIRAMARVQGARLILVGEGERKKSLKRLTKSIGMEKQVALTGYIPDSELSALMETCDVLCLPSIERTEAFGVVLLEAMRYARPVIASGIPGSGVGWVVRDREVGLLVQPGDEDALAEALLKMQASPDLRWEMGVAGKKLFDNSFHIDQVAAKLASIYSEVVK